jgi:hypothetical protein
MSILDFRFALEPKARKPYSKSKNGAPWLEHRFLKQDEFWLLFRFAAGRNDFVDPHVGDQVSVVFPVVSRVKK